MGDSMVGIVIVSHLKLAEEMLKTAELIVGPIESAKALSLDPKQDVDVMRNEIKKAIKEVQAGEGVIVLTDMFGGTPSNLALTFLDAGIEVISGFNLPMLIKIATHREGLDVTKLALIAKEYGISNINVATEFISKKK